MSYQYIIYKSAINNPSRKTKMRNMKTQWDCGLKFSFELETN